MKIREIQIRTALFCVALASLAWGFQALLFGRLPFLFADPIEDMSHGYLVIAMALYLLWRKRAALVASVGEPSLKALVFILPSAFFGFLGVRGLQVRFEIVAFVGFLFGLVWLTYGWRTCRCAAFPLLFLLFCLPMHTYLDLVTIHLRLLAVSIAYGTLHSMGVDIVRHGTMLVSASNSFAIDIAEPCSGLRSLFALMALTTAYSYFTQPTWLRRGILIATAIPIAVLGNSIRIITIVAIAATCSSDFALGFYHDYSGYIVYFVAVLVMLSLGALMDKGAEQCARS